MAVGIVSTWTSEFIADVMVKPLFQPDNVFNTDLYRLDPAVFGSKTQYIANNQGRILASKTACGFSATNGSAANFTEKRIRTQKVAINLEQCAQDFRDTVFQKNLKGGTSFYDVSDTVLEETILNMVGNRFAVDTFDLGWFGNTGSSTPFFQTFDGWFKKLEDNLPAGSKVTISTTGSLSAGQGLDILRDVFAKRNEMRSVPTNEKAFLVTDTIYLNALKTYEDKEIDTSLDLLMNGDGVLMFRGIPVLPQLRWDVVISDEGLDSPHRVVYTRNENLYVGTDIANPSGDAQLFFDELNEKYYFKWNFEYGVQFMFDEHTVYARYA